MIIEMIIIIVMLLFLFYLIIDFFYKRNAKKLTEVYYGKDIEYRRRVGEKASIGSASIGEPSIQGTEQLQGRELFQTSSDNSIADDKPKSSIIKRFFTRRKEGVEL